MLESSRYLLDKLDKVVPPLAASLSRLSPEAMLQQPGVALVAAGREGAGLLHCEVLAVLSLRLAEVSNRCTAQVDACLSLGALPLQPRHLGVELSHLASQPFDRH